MKRIQKIVLGGIAYAFLVFSLLGQNSNVVKSSSSIQQEKWKMFSSEKGGFSICLPGLPEYTNIVVKTQVGQIRMFRVYVWQPDDEAEYSVVYTDYPKGSQNLSPKERFDAARAALKARPSWRIEYEKDLLISGSPGKEFGFAVSSKSNVSGRIRIVCGDDRLYQAQIIFHRTNPHLEDFEKFFDSFKIEDKVENREK